MPPEQCPSCGRFLKQELVASLGDASAPCPRCGTVLDAASFRPAPPSEAVADGAATASAVATSVRPPDLQPDHVRGDADPLEGWDVGVPVDVAAVADDRPFPIDTVVVVGSAVVGAAVGALVGHRPVRDAVLGTVAGAVGAGVVRRIWRAP